MTADAQVPTEPFWQQGRAVPELPADPPPSAADVVIVGGGYTGLSAARETALAGARTVVLEAGAIGAGCSGRNGGQVAHSIKPTLAQLTARHGRERAFAICREGFEAVAYLRALAIEEGLDCDWRPNGCFFGAHTPRHFAAMVREARNPTAGLEQRITPVSRAEQHREIASDAYHGGCVYHDDASVDPQRLLMGLLGRATAAGASVLAHCPAGAIRPRGEGFEVSTSRGVIRTRQVLIATNGYSGPLSPWLRRRVIPIGSYQIATEPLGAARVRELIPEARNIVDSRRVVTYFRPSPDGERIVYGGRAALAERDPRACIPRLRAMLTQVFPQLERTAVTHAWVGWVAYTFDTLPHLGRHDGIWYCAGYCGQGVPLAPFYGRRVGQQMMGLPEGRTALDGLPFPTRFYYHGDPWFLTPSVLVYRALDAAGL